MVGLAILVVKHQKPFLDLNKGQTEDRDYTYTLLKLNITVMI